MTVHGVFRLAPFPVFPISASLLLIARRHSATSIPLSALFSIFCRAVFEAKKGEYAGSNFHNPSPLQASWLAAITPLSGKSKAQAPNSIWDGRPGQTDLTPRRKGAKARRDGEKRNFCFTLALTLNPLPQERK
jgi:hypothetical protein